MKQPKIPLQNSNGELFIICFLSWERLRLQRLGWRAYVFNKFHVNSDDFFAAARFSVSRLVSVYLAQGTESRTFRQRVLMSRDLL